MGKIRVKTIGDETSEAEEKQKKAVKKAQKLARESAEVENINEEATEETSQKEPTQTQEPQGEKTETIAEEVKAPKKKKDKFAKIVRKRSAQYNEKAMEIDRNKAYSLSEALELLRKVRLAKFDETVELHINTTVDGISGNVKLPHGSGKEVKVAIADDALISEVEKGKINFDVLIATPDMMPSLAKVAKFLGPRGLMPNPKNGTISAKPEEAAKAFSGGQMHFKTESKLPIMHLTVGKISFENNQLSENIKTVITAVKKDRIRSVVLKSTMSPAIRIQI